VLQERQRIEDEEVNSNPQDPLPDATVPINPGLRPTPKYLGRLGKGKGKGLDTCYSANYMSQTCDQQRFTISVVAADWHEPMVPQRIMWPSIARANGQLDPRCS